MDFLGGMPPTPESSQDRFQFSTHLKRNGSLTLSSNEGFLFVANVSLTLSAVPMIAWPRLSDPKPGGSTMISSLALMIFAAVAQPQQPSCEGLKSLSLPNVTITTAEFVASG